MAKIRPKYQVFISSTYMDLEDVRKKVTWSVLNTRNIPAGMEAFPSTDDRGWKIIQRLIDCTDYYVLLLAGRYGSYDDAVKMSWTHREYRYARQQGIPVLAFKREDSHITKAGMESEPNQQERLRAFEKEVADAHKWTRWTTADDLAEKVSFSLTTAIADDLEDGKPRPGWYRGGAATGMSGEWPVQASPEIAESVHRAIQSAGTTLHGGRVLRVMSSLGTVGYRGLGTDSRVSAVHHATGSRAGMTFTSGLGFGYVVQTRWMQLEPILGFPVGNEYSTPYGSRAEYEGGHLEWHTEKSEVQIYSDIVDGGRLVSTVKLK